MRYQPANASAAKWRLFRLLTPASYTPLAQRSHRGHGGRGGPSACKKGSLRDLKTGTGFAGAKLSEILPAARDARFVRMTEIGFCAHEFGATIEVTRDEKNNPVS